MSEKEKALVEKVAQMPERVKQRFLDQAEGALLMQEAMKEECDDESERQRDG